MKRILLFILFATIHIFNSAYGQGVTQKLKKENGVLYVVNKGRDFVVDTKVITVMDHENRPQIPKVIIIISTLMGGILVFTL